MHDKTASLAFEYDLIAQGYRWIVGIDEAGRGAWAGPVAAGAVCLPSERGDLLQALEGVRDSKLLTPRARERLIDAIKATACGWGVGRAEASEIDAIGIVPATLLAMQRAVATLMAAFPQVDPDFLLIDSIKWQGFPDREVPYQAIVKGDQLSLSIAAASILAKVTRDHWMIEYGAEYPQYGFAAHKGYGAKQHQAAIRDHGACPLHRMTYRPLAQLPLPFEETEQ